jgi:DNA-binding Lrp family transcriptional regulator
MSLIGHPEVPPDPDPATAGSLRAVGISELDEQLYRALLHNPGAPLSQLTAATGTSPVLARRGLDRLETMGLVSRQGQPSRFVPAAPDMAVEALILSRQEELERCRMAAAALLAEYREAGQSAGELVEVIIGREATFQRYRQLLTTARGEVLMFDKPPYIGPAENPLEVGVLSRGVTWKAVYAPEALEIPERMAQLRVWQEAGEQARVCGHVPLKLVMVDRALALLPLTADSQAETEEHTAILVHPCSLLTTLGMLFDMLWQQSLPLRWTGPLTSSDTGLDDIDRTVLQLLTAGFKDQAIARNLDVSLRTVRRRLSNLMAAHGLTSRFQLGQLAVQRGWV